MDTSKSRWLLYTERAVTLASRAMSYIGAFIVMFMVMLVTATVFSRYVFNWPIKGTVEIIELMMLAVVFLGLAYTQYTKSHIEITLLYDRLPQKARDFVDIFGYIVSFGIVCLLAWRAFVHFSSFADRGSLTSVLEMPIAPFQFVLAFGWLMLGLVLLLNLVHSIFKAFKARQ